jgi:hypothetical protein
VRKLIADKLNEGVLHATQNTLLFLILQKGITATFSDGSKSTERFSGYHDVLSYQGTDVAYVVLPSPWDSPASDNASFDLFTAAYAHELAEAVTDKVPGKGWISEDGLESADLEPGVLAAWGPPNDCSRFVVQAYYTNERGPTIGAWREKVEPGKLPQMQVVAPQAQPRIDQFSALGTPSFVGVSGFGGRRAKLVAVGPGGPTYNVARYVYLDSEGGHFDTPVPVGVQPPQYLVV